MPVMSRFEAEEEARRRWGLAAWVYLGDVFIVGHLASGQRDQVMGHGMSWVAAFADYDRKVS